MPVMTVKYPLMRPNSDFLKLQKSTLPYVLLSCRMPKTFLTLCKVLLNFKSHDKVLKLPVLYEINDNYVVGRQVGCKDDLDTCHMHGHV